jgi:hypothetical protein
MGQHNKGVVTAGEQEFKEGRSAAAVLRSPIGASLREGEEYSPRGLPIALVLVVILDLDLSSVPATMRRKSAKPGRRLEWGPSSE